MRKEDTSVTDIKEIIIENKGNSWAKGAEEQTNKCNNNLNKSNAKGSHLLHFTSSEEEWWKDGNISTFHEKSVNDEEVCEDKNKCEFDKSIDGDPFNNYRSSMFAKSDRTSKASVRRKNKLQNIESSSGAEFESETTDNSSLNESDDGYSLLRYISETVKKYASPIVPIIIETEDFRQEE